MNRGRHHHQMDEIAKLAKKYGAKYPKAWSKGITYNTLVKLISTQEYFCKFNNLNVFETKSFDTACTARGGFQWSWTPQGMEFWYTTLNKLNHKINEYLKQNNLK